MSSRTKLVFIITIAVLLAAPSPASACRFVLPEAFKPTLASLSPWTPGPVSTRRQIPAPAISVLEIGRGEPDSNRLCGSFGRLLLSVGVPASSAYPIDELGVYFRIVEGKDPGGIFGNVPFKPRPIDGEESQRILLWWPEVTPAQPLNMRVEAFFVTNGLEIGPPTTFAVGSRAEQDSE